MNKTITFLASLFSVSSYTPVPRTLMGLWWPSGSHSFTVWSIRNVFTYLVNNFPKLDPYGRPAGASIDYDIFYYLEFHSKRKEVLYSQAFSLADCRDDNKGLKPQQFIL